MPHRQRQLPLRLPAALNIDFQNYTLSVNSGCSSTLEWLIIDVLADSL